MTLRYVIKHSEADGEIKRGNNGFDYIAASIYKESDEQLFFFTALAKYLLITKDYGFPNEKVAYYPAEVLLFQIESDMIRWGDFENRLITYGPGFTLQLLSNVFRGEGDAAYQRFQVEQPCTLQAVF